jgi:hypothetical protein
VQIDLAWRPTTEDAAVGRFAAFIRGTSARVALIACLGFTRVRFCGHESSQHVHRPNCSLL